MTTAPTERNSLSMQGSSGGEHGSSAALDRKPDGTGLSAKPIDQSSAGQKDSGTAYMPESHQFQTLIIDDVFEIGPHEPQYDLSHQGPAKDEEEYSDVDIGGEELSLPYPTRPSLSSFKTIENKDERGHLPETLGLDSKRLAETKPSALRQKNLPKAQNSALLGYSLWTGNHTEDRTSELVIKSGYQAKQVVLNENNTARPTLGPHLKNHTGLRNLSTFFASILQKRQEGAKLVAPSTFKPPPRVTLTDTKREVWLGDLANSSVPLRKLSRTIPHGIRGKVLLEQCMAKNVPLTRAIWLAKCVGANELRAFRRKGISGPMMVENEQKWIKDWTLVLEAFIEDVGRISDESDWKLRIIYALRLTSRIFAEGLLDKDHFVDWTLTKFESATFDHVPFTLLLVQVIRPAITQSLRHGRRLSTITLSKLHELSTYKDKDLLMPLINRLVHLITSLALQYPQCVIVRQVWRRCRGTFLSTMQDYEQTSAKMVDEAQETSQRDTATVLRRIMEKNDMISRSTSNVASPEETPELTLARALDSFQPQMSIESVASRCLTIVPETRQLIKMLLQWATSAYREGLYRIFMVERLIRRWRDEGYETDVYILSSLDDLRHSLGLNPRKMSRLVADLIRSGHFDAIRFLRSLISTGGLYNEDRPLDLQILVDMPLSHMPPNVAGLRSMLIRSYASSDTRKSRLAEQDIANEVERFLTVGDDGEYYTPYLKISPSELSLSKVFEITDLIHRSLLSVPQKNRKHEMAVESTNTNLHSTTAHAKRVVETLEILNDIVAIPEVLSTFVPDADLDCLVFIMETVELHFEDFAAAGAVESLFQSTIQRYHILKATQPPLKRLVAPMHNICTRLPSYTRMVSFLNRELASCSANSGLVANTPMSDIQVEAASESDNELERLLAGGAIMDFARLSQAFEIILSRTKATKFDQHYSALASILGTLKGQNEDIFQEVLATWLRTEISKGETLALARAVAFLVRAGCVDLSSFAAAVERICDELASQDTDAGIAASVKVLGLFLLDSQNDTSGPFDIRIRVETISRICEVNAEFILRLLLRALRSDENSVMHMAVEQICQSDRLLGLLRRIVVDNPTAATSILEAGAMLDHPVGAGQLKNVVARLVDPLGQHEFLKLSNPEQVKVIFETVDGFSLPFYELYLRCMRTDTVEPQISKACLEAVVKCEIRDCQIWPTLISAVDSRVAQQVRTSAEGHVLINSSTPDEALDRLRGANYPDVRIWSKVIEATSFGIPEQGDAETGRNIEKAFGLAISIVAGSVDRQDGLLQQWLQALCHLTIIHSRSYSSSTQLKIAHALCGLLARNVRQLTLNTLGAVFDTAAHIVEDLSLQTFALVRSNLGPLKSDWRVRFLFGIEEDADGWLYAMRASTTEPTQAAEQTTSSLFPLRRWELLPESAANVGANDTALSLRLFEATKVL